MTALELIRSKQAMNKAAEDHAKAVKQRIDEEDAAKFSPLKKIYDEVRHLPARLRNSREGSIKKVWEYKATDHFIGFWDWGGDIGWRLSIESGTFYLNHYGKKTTENAEEAKGWLVEKLADILEQAG
ncbi:MAG: hypothetical protein EBU96_06050 [Actinobacteria bacterium]|nr:hypothetical protein [Actinomycetota bacterium]